MQKHVLKIIEKTFKVNSIEPQAQPLKVPMVACPMPRNGASSAVARNFCMARRPRHLVPQEKLNELEAELGQHRGSMSLGYTDATGTWQKASSVQLSNTVKTNDDEATREAAWQVRMTGVWRIISSHGMKQLPASLVRT
jgi:hypothetical protein